VSTPSSKPPRATAAGRPPRSARVTAAMTAAALLAAGVLAGCGSSGNGVSAKEPKEILNASEAAIGKASSVTINSKSSVGPLSLSADLKLTRSGGGQATLNLVGIQFEVIRVGETVYLKGSPEFYRRLGVTAPPSGTWLRGPATGRLGETAAFTNLTSQATRIISTGGMVTKGASTTVEGQPVIELKTEGKLYQGRLYIKTTGEPYPVKLEKSGRENSHTTFTNWNSTSPPTPPSATTPIAK
jgi:hypothetical protein